MNDLNSFEKRLLVKPSVFIDASIILGSGVDGFSPEDGCAKYLSKANKEYKPFITKPIMGEIFGKICLIKDSIKATNAFELIKELLTTRNFVLIGHLNHDSIFEYLSNNCSIVPHDDRLHLCNIYASVQTAEFKEKYNHKAIHFATIDTNVNNPDVVRKLSSRLGIKIINPKTI